MAREVKPASARLAALEAMFGKEAQTFFLNQAGDYAIGRVESIGSMETEFGAAPYIDFVLEEGDSAETESVVPGERYRLAFLGKVMAGRFSSLGIEVGSRFAAMNRGEKSNRAGTQKYKNVEVRILGSE